MRLCQKSIYSKIDIQKAFWQIKLTESSKKFTGSIFRGKHVFFNRLPFGVKIASAKFMRAIRRALWPALLRKVKVYLDGILINSSSREEHIKIKRKVLQRLHNHGLTINRNKSEWRLSEVTFLRYTLNEHQIIMVQETK